MWRAFAIAMVITAAATPAAADYHGHWRGGGWGRPQIVVPSDPLSGFIGGIVGGWIGSRVAPAPPPPPPPPAPPPAVQLTPFTPDWYDYCRGKYQSFDAQSGYFTGYDGAKHFCR